MRSGHDSSDRDTLDLSFDDDEQFGLWVAALRVLIPEHALGPDLRVSSDDAKPRVVPSPAAPERAATTSVRPTAAAKAELQNLFGEVAGGVAAKTAADPFATPSFGPAGANDPFASAFAAAAPPPPAAGTAKADDLSTFSVLRPPPQPPRRPRRTRSRLWWRHRRCEPFDIMPPAASAADLLPHCPPLLRLNAFGGGPRIRGAAHGCDLLAARGSSQPSGTAAAVPAGLVAPPTMPSTINAGVCGGSAAPWGSGWGGAPGTAMGHSAVGGACGGAMPVAGACGGVHGTPQQLAELAEVRRQYEAMQRQYQAMQFQHGQGPARSGFN